MAGVVASGPRYNAGVTASRRTPGPTVRVYQRGGDKSTHPALRAVCQHYVRHLLPDLCDGLQVRLELRGARALGPDTDALLRMPDEYTARPREYRILLHRRITLGEQVVGLAHEVVHLHQLATGRLAYAKVRGVVHGQWDGVDLGPMAALDYWTGMPWEADARAREKALCASAWPVLERYLQPIRPAGLPATRTATAAP